MSANNWTAKDIRVGNAIQPSGDFIVRGSMFATWEAATKFAEEYVQ